MHPDTTYAPALFFLPSHATITHPPLKKKKAHHLLSAFAKCWHFIAFFGCPHCFSFFLNFFSHLEKAHPNHLLSAFAICWHLSNTLSALTCPATAVSAASCAVARGLLRICGLILLTIYTIYTIYVAYIHYI